MCCLRRAMGTEKVCDTRQACSCSVCARGVLASCVSCVVCRQVLLWCLERAFGKEYCVAVTAQLQGRPADCADCLTCCRCCCRCCCCRLMHGVSTVFPCPVQGCVCVRSLPRTLSWCFGVACVVCISPGHASHAAGLSGDMGFSPYNYTCGCAVHCYGDCRCRCFGLGTHPCTVLVAHTLCRVS